MSIFGAIKDAIWGKAKAAEPAPAPVAAEAAPAAAPVMDTPPQNVDVTALLDSLQANNDEKLNWRVSIVDLMKLIGLDASLTNRKELADELGYTGAKDGSAEMNIWLHKQVMTKLAENGGTIPEELTH
ncbi:MAG: DUF3597 domain-containing protein [Sphingomonas sp.]